MTVSSTRPTLNQRSITHDTPVDTTHMALIIALAVVGLLLVVCVIVFISCKFFKIEVHSRQNPRQQRPEAGLIPMQVTASAGHCSDDILANSTRGLPADDTQASNSNEYSLLQQPSTPVAGAACDIVTGESCVGPFVQYDLLPDNSWHSN